MMYSQTILLEKSYEISLKDKKNNSVYILNINYKNNVDLKNLLMKENQFLMKINFKVLLQKKNIWNIKYKCDKSYKSISYFQNLILHVYV